MLCSNECIQKILFEQTCRGFKKEGLHDPLPLQQQPTKPKTMVVVSTATTATTAERSASAESTTAEQSASAKSTTAEQSASAESPVTELTELLMASEALLQMSSLPDRDEMLCILSFYGPETIPRNLDLRHLKPDQCYVEYVFKEWNPTFASQFYPSYCGEWLPYMGEARERDY